MLPSGWEKQAIGKLCQSIVPGRNKPKSFDGHIPWITTPEIQGRYIPSKVQKNYVSFDAIKESGAKIVPIGSVIISAVGELGLTAIAKEEIVLNQQLHAFVCPDYICNEYLAYWLGTQKYYMDSVASKTTIPYMNKANCESIPVAYPPLPEQQKIAQILSTWDKAIEKLEALIAAKQKRKKALMQQLLTGKKRFAGFVGEWKIFSLSKICELGAGQSAPQEEKYFRNGSYEFLRVSDIGGSNRRWAPKSRDKVNDLAIKTFGLKSVPKRATLFTKSGASLLLNQRAQLEKETFVVSHLGYAIARKNICSDFLYFLLCEIDFKKYAAGTSLPALQLSTLANVKIAVPPSLEEQQKIASVLAAADKEIETQQKQLSTLKEQKKGLMQQLLTGKKRVKVEAHV